MQTLFYFVGDGARTLVSPSVGATFESRRYRPPYIFYVALPDHAVGCAYYGYAFDLLQSLAADIVVGADALRRVAEKVYADGVFGADGVNIEDVAAHGERADVFGGIFAGVPH